MECSRKKTPPSRIGKFTSDQDCEGFIFLHREGTWRLEVKRKKKGDSKGGWGTKGGPPRYQKREKRAMRGGSLNLRKLGIATKESDSRMKVKYQRTWAYKKREEKREGKLMHILEESIGLRDVVLQAPGVPNRAPRYGAHHHVFFQKD